METMQFTWMIFIYMISAIPLSIDTKSVNKEQWPEEGKCDSVVFQLAECKVSAEFWNLSLANIIYLFPVLVTLYLSFPIWWPL
jgi:hypothetical protein